MQKTKVKIFMAESTDLQNLIPTVESQYQSWVSDGGNGVKIISVDTDLSAVCAAHGVGEIHTWAYALTVIYE